MNIKQLHEKFEQYFKDWSKDCLEMQDLYNATNEDDILCALYNIAATIGLRKGWGEEGIGELQQQFIKEMGLDLSSINL